MNKFEVFKAAKDGLDVWPDLVRYAEACTPIAEIPEDDLQRFKWWGVFHRPQTPGQFMVRLRVPGGRMTAAQLGTIAEVARDDGHGAADITSRQNIQLRGLALAQLPAVIRRLNDAGVLSLQTGLDNVRNYIGCPLAGIDGDEVIDTTPILAALGAAHLGNRAYSNLPRKFNVSIAGCAEDCGHAQTQDLGFVPGTVELDSGTVLGFNVLVGGALGGTTPRLATPLDVFVEPHEVVALTLAVLRVFRDHGPREKRTAARLKFLLADWGEVRFREAVTSELGHELRRAGTPATTRAAGDHLGVHAQRQAGLFYVGLHVPVGRVTAAQLLEVARLAEAYGDGEVRLTIDQNLVLTGVPDARVAALLAEPLLRELRPDATALWRNLVTCTGNDYCHYSLIDTKTRAVELVTELDRRGVTAPEGTRLHISGCVHACGKHHIGDIGLQGANVRVGDAVEEAADVYLGGRLGADGRLAQKTGDRVLMSEMADTVQRLLEQQCGAARDATEAAPAGKGRM